MKKLLVLLLVATLTLSSGVLTFAEEGDNNLRGERVTLSREEKGEKIIELFNSYYPSGLVDFEAVKAEHDLFHDTTKAERETYVAELKVEIMAYREAFKAQEITQEEFQAIIDTFKSNKEAFRAAIEVLKLEKQADNESVQASLTTVREGIKAELSNEVVDEAVMQSLLQLLIDYSNDHLDIDYYYYDQVQLLK